MTENHHDETALVPVAPARLPLEQDIEMLGRAMAASGFFKDIKSASQAMVKILAGKEIGLPPIAAMTGIHLIDGKVSLGANLIAAAVKRSGRYNYRVREHTADGCRIEFFEHGESVGISEFTMQDAQAANLTGKAVWRQYPRNMLFARALTNGARWYCADVFGGAVYTEEELEHDERGPYLGQSAQVVYQTEPIEPAPVVQAEPAAPVTDWEGNPDPAPNGDAQLEADLDAAFRAQVPTIRFPRNAPGMQEFIKLVELARPSGLGLDADARKDALGGKSVNKYMTDAGWQDDPAALDRVWALLEARVLATEAAEVAATE